MAFSPPTTAPSRQRPKLGPTHPTQAGDRIIISAVEGFGKTSLGAFANKPAMLMAKGETGYQTLLSRGLVPQCDSVLLENWSDTLGTVNDLASSQEYKTIVLDAIGGFERICHEFVTRRDFDGKAGEDGFLSFHKGYEVSLLEWQKLLAGLDAARECGTRIIILAHTKIKPFTPPGHSEGYSRYAVDIHEKTWGITHKWADAVLFGNFDIRVVGKRGGKKVGEGGKVRYLYPERSAEWDAKNRFGLREPIELPDGPQAAWSTLAAVLDARPNIQSLSQPVSAVVADEIPE